MAFAWEAVRQGFKDLHVIDRHGSCCTWLLNAVGAIKIYETDWMGWGEMAGKLDINLERIYKAGKMILEDYSHGAMAMRFLAGAIGAPFIPYYAPLGSDLYNPDYDALGKAGLRTARTRESPRRNSSRLKSPSGAMARLSCCPQPGPSWPSSMSPRWAIRARPAGAASAPSTRKSPLPATRSSSWPKKSFPKRK